MSRLFATSLSTLALGLAADAEAQPCTLTQVTNAVGSPGSVVVGYPAVSGDGATIAFVSNEDYGNNPEGDHELFLYDTTTSTLTQATVDALPMDENVSIDRTGSRVVFSSLADHTGGNPDGSNEVFWLDTATLAITQLSDNADGVAFRPKISRNGTAVAYRYQSATAQSVVLRFIDSGSTVSLNFELDDFVDSDVAISADASILAFASTADRTGQNPDGSLEMFLVDVGAKGETTQLTDGTSGSNRFPSLDGTGRFLTFFSDALGSGSGDVFLVDLMTFAIAQVSPLGSGSNHLPVISENGLRIAFGSTGDPLGTNPDGAFVLFTYDRLSGTYRQLTDAGPAQHWSIDADGSHVPVLSGGNLLGQDPDGSQEIYLSTCPGVVDVADDSPSPISPLRVDRNPVVRRAEFSFDASLDATDVDVFDVHGRRAARLPAALGRAVWADIAVAPGLYFAKLRGTSGAPTRIVVTR